MLSLVENEDDQSHGSDVFNQYRQSVGSSHARSSLWFLHSHTRSKFSEDTSKTQLYAAHHTQNTSHIPELHILTANGLFNSLRKIVAIYFLQFLDIHSWFFLQILHIHNKPLYATIHTSLYAIQQEFCHFHI